MLQQFTFSTTPDAWVPDEMSLLFSFIFKIITDVI